MTNPIKPEKRTFNEVFKDSSLHEKRVRSPSTSELLQSTLDQFFEGKSSYPLLIDRLRSLTEEEIKDDKIQAILQTYHEIIKTQFITAIVSTRNRPLLLFYINKNLIQLSHALDQALHNGWELDEINLLLGHPLTTEISESEKKELLFDAIMYANIAAFESMFKAFGLSCDTPLDNEGNSPLHLAIQTRQDALMHFILDEGASLTQLNVAGTSATEMAIQYQELPIALNLFLRGAPLPKSQAVMQLLQYAPMDKKRVIMARAIVEGIFLDYVGKNGWTFLHYAASDFIRSTRSFFQLVRNGANPFVKDINGDSPAIVGLRLIQESDTPFYFCLFFSVLFGIGVKEESVANLIAAEVRDWNPETLNQLKRDYGVSLLELAYVLGYTGWLNRVEIDFEAEKAALLAKYPVNNFYLLEEGVQKLVPDHLNDEMALKPQYAESLDSLLECWDQCPSLALKGELRHHIEGIIHHVKGRIPFLGTPRADHPEELETFYHKLELKLLSLGFLLGKEPQAGEEFKEVILLDLAEAGKYCATRWKEVADMSVLRLAPKERPQDFREQILSQLSEWRFCLFQNLLDLIDSAQDVHSRNFFLYHLGKKLGILGHDTAYNDPTANFDPALLIKFENAFNVNYGVTNIISYIDKKIREGVFNLELIKQKLLENIPSDYMPQFETQKEMALNLMEEESALNFQDLTLRRMAYEWEGSSKDKKSLTRKAILSFLVLLNIVEAGAL